MLTNVKGRLNDVYESVGSYGNRTFNKLRCLSPLVALIRAIWCGTPFQKRGVLKLIATHYNIIVAPFVWH